VLCLTVLASCTRLLGLTSGLDDADVRAPSVLPGWTRGHVLAHIAGITDAQARQAENAVNGVLTEVYDGGRPARDAAIEEFAGRSADEHRAAVTAAVARLATAWASTEDWTRPTKYGDGDVLSTVYCLWRETEIHTADLGLVAPSWSDEFNAHAQEFLRVRIPEDVVLLGDPTDVTAWLAGRSYAGQVTAKDGDLPELGPWP
jgi:maleylpyruvate isomerase